MRLGVTGGSGFIGSHVVDALAGAGHHVTVIDPKAPHRSDVEHEPLDLRDGPALEHATKGLDAIFHLAAYADVNDVSRDPVGALDLNVTGTLRVLEAARANAIGRVFLASTVWVYSSATPEAQSAPEIDENAALAASATRHVYTTTKIAAEMLCHDYWNAYQVPFTVLRYGIPYGPRMRPSLVIPIFVRKALAGEPITIAGDGSQHRKFVYVEDLARAHVLALADVARNQTYNLDGSEVVTIRRIAEVVLAAIPTRSTIEFMPARAGDYEGAAVSSAKAHTELGWEPRVGFADGVRRTIDWLTALEERDVAGSQGRR
jgi:UDP-glucose 4-epimerase